MGGSCLPLLPQLGGDGVKPAAHVLTLCTSNDVFHIVAEWIHSGHLIRCSNQRGGQRATHVFQRPLSFVGVIPGIPYSLRGGG